MANTLGECLLEQVKALKSKIDEAMVSHTDKDDDYEDFMRESPPEPELGDPESMQIQVVVDVHNSPRTRTSFLCKLCNKGEKSKKMTWTTMACQRKRLTSHLPASQCLNVQR